jgi:hypothetical protein
VVGEMHSIFFFGFPPPRFGKNTTVKSKNK